MDALPESLSKEEKILNTINQMSHFEMCYLWRYAAVGHPYFAPPYAQIFKARLFDHFGGFTPKISKALN